MAGPLKRRTGFRSSPEDAEFYRKFHDSALSALQQGRSRSEILQELTARGVPAESAERVVRAVEQEAAVSDWKPDHSVSKWISAMVFGTLGMMVMAVVIWSRLSESGVSLKGLLPPLFIVLIVSGLFVARSLRKLRGP